MGSLNLTQRAKNHTALHHRTDFVGDVECFGSDSRDVRQKPLRLRPCRGNMGVLTIRVGGLGFVSLGVAV